MSVREKLNDKKLGTGVAIALLVLAGSIFTYYLMSHWHPSVDVTHAYYSDDDGQSYFKGSVYDFPPFDHDGKTAVQAILAESNGHRFVGFLTRYMPSARKQLQERYDGAVKDGLPVQKTVLDLMMALSGQMEVKVPGSGHPWIPSSRVGTLDVRSPDGKVPDRYIDQP
jgi:hypothetical protein